MRSRFQLDRATCQRPRELKPIRAHATVLEKGVDHLIRIAQNHSATSTSDLAHERPLFVVRVLELVTDHQRPAPQYELKNSATAKKRAGGRNEVVIDHPTLLATQELDASLRLKFWQRRSAPSIATERADESPRERVKREDLNAAVGAPQDIGGG